MRVRADRSRSSGGSTASIFINAVWAPAASLTPANARTKRVPTTSDSSSSAVNISGGMSEPLRNT